MSKVLFEVCVDSVSGALAAERAGADRVELCAELGVGGTTPTHGLLERTLARCTLPVFSMIRCRSGDFVYDDLEIETMLTDVTRAKALGVAGIVFGALLSDGSIDTQRTRSICAAADPLPVTFHRAFDHARDPHHAVEQIIESGCRRLLTSGQKPSAPLGASLIRELSDSFAGRLTFMPGAGVRPENIGQLISDTGCHEVHFSGRVRQVMPPGERPDVAIGGPQTGDHRWTTDEAKIRATIFAAAGNDSMQ